MRYGLLLVIALLLAGCAAIRSQILPDTELEDYQVIQLINYSQRVAAMTAEQQRHEYSASIQAYAEHKDVKGRIRLALLLATPGASVQDTARAAGLLEPLTAPNDAASPLRSFARLLYAQLNERANEQKYASQMHDQIQALKEADRTMRKQLEELKELERSILQRERESQRRH
jgi:uncharacterized protein YceK